MGTVFPSDCKFVPTNFTGYTKTHMLAFITLEFKWFFQIPTLNKVYVLSNSSGQRFRR